MKPPAHGDNERETGKDGRRMPTGSLQIAIPSLIHCFTFAPMFARTAILHPVEGPIEFFPIELSASGQGFLP
jgi:hypothetical protein